LSIVADFAASILPSLSDFIAGSFAGVANIAEIFAGGAAKILAGFLRGIARALDFSLGGVDLLIFLFAGGIGVGLALRVLTPRVTSEHGRQEDSPGCEDDPGKLIP
jgi:hypothetical protein